MIITRIQGGIGNSIFQWASAKSLELDGFESYIDISHYSNQIDVTVREFLLDSFPSLSYNLYTGQQNGKQFLNVPDNSKYTPVQYNEDYNFYLNGYWQSEKYFKHNEAEIRRQLLPNSDVIFKLSEKYFNLNNRSVALHVRRGDYVNQQQNHPVQPMEYYQKAIDSIGDYDQLYVFSDDINWCKSNLNFDKIVYVNNDSDLEDLWMMSMCKHNIIANSSFSWWGAYLNSNPDKIVIAPKLWFGKNLNLSTDDLIPSGWLII